MGFWYYTVLNICMIVAGFNGRFQIYRFLTLVKVSFSICKMLFEFAATVLKYAVSLCLWSHTKDYSMELQVLEMYYTQ